MTDADRCLLGQWLRERRLERGLTQTAIAERLHIDVSHVCGCERTRYMPSIDLLDRWLRLFGVDLLGALGMRVR